MLEICKYCVNKSEWKSSPDSFTFGSFKSQSPNGVAVGIVCEVKHPILNQKEAEMIDKARESEVIESHCPWPKPMRLRHIASEEQSDESSSSFFSTSLFDFSTGNFRTKETRGLLRLFPDFSPLRDYLESELHKKYK
ncbi:putative BRCA1-associated protein isoform X1 [Sesbania bispinosa]|nr:putative BRCA1-associated protein isoform X1 [Sesbania bispinosa]